MKLPPIPNHRSFLLRLPFLLFFLFLLPSARALTPAEEPVVKVVAQARPSVVNIYTETVVQQAVNDPFDAFFDRFYGGGAYRGGRIVQVPIRSLGSGAIVDAKGYIVTNEHVIARAENTTIKVTLADGRTFEASPLREDPDQDLAMIKIKADKPLPVLNINDLSPNLLGQTVIAIGNPIGYESSVSTGILSAINRTLSIGGTNYDSLLQTDAAINPGNSGGPLIDISGKFVGLNTAKAGAGVENIGFAIPGERVAVFVKNAIDIAEGRKAAPPEVSLEKVLTDRFGFSLQEMDPNLAASFAYPPGSGLLVTSVQEGSPADAVGIRKGMLVTGIGAYRVRALSELPRQLARLKKGESIRLNLAFNEKRGNLLLRRSVAVDLKAR
ncbi:MAG: trypsin-like serine protease [Blastochloris sp.]|nr:trypsin-like serine protease [Blastochloris sp.]